MPSRRIWSNSPTCFGERWQARIDHIFFLARAACMVQRCGTAMRAMGAQRSARPLVHAPVKMTLARWAPGAATPTSRREPRPEPDMSMQGLLVGTHRDEFFQLVEAGVAAISPELTSDRMWDSSASCAVRPRSSPEGTPKDRGERKELLRERRLRLRYCDGDHAEVGLRISFVPRRRRRARRRPAQVQKDAWRGRRRFFVAMQIVGPTVAESASASGGMSCASGSYDSFRTESDSFRGPRAQ